MSMRGTVETGSVCMYNERLIEAGVYPRNYHIGVREVLCEWG